MAITEFTRAVVRPIVTIISMAVIAQVIIEEIDIPPQAWAFLVAFPLWWFTDRTVGRRKTNGKEMD